MSTFIKLHDTTPDHPKVIGLSDAAFRTYVESICYCSRYLTDGFVPMGAVRKMTNAKAVTELISARLLIKVDGGVQVHDYLDHQTSREHVEAVREKRRKSGYLGGRPPKQNESKPKANEKQNALQMESKTKAKHNPELRTHNSEQDYGSDVLTPSVCTGLDTDGVRDQIEVAS